MRLLNDLKPPSCQGEHVFWYVHLYGWICTCMIKHIWGVLGKGQISQSFCSSSIFLFFFFSLFLPPPCQNSIRHNLSLHSRFVRVQNEGTGKSSWWMLNPEGGKSGKSPRRRAASMDNNSKFTKSRGRAAKKKVLEPESISGLDTEMIRCSFKLKQKFQFYFETLCLHMSEAFPVNVKCQDDSWNVCELQPQ